MQPKIIGIDLGTTNSCAAYVDKDGKVILIPYRGGEFTIPSVFAIDNKGRELVGYEAKRQLHLNPTNTVYGSKRLIGNSIDSDIVKEMSTSVAFKMEKGPDDTISIPLRGQNFSPTDLAGKILGKIRDVASEHFGAQVTQAVVTVPAYFNDRQRQEVKRAGELCGLEIVSIINEPTSAALAYGAGKSRRERVAVYDLGGGTFDISIIEIRDQVFEVKATGGAVFLGGLDFDRELMRYVIGEFQTQTGIDLGTDPVAMQRLKDMAEQVKIELSSREEADFFIPFITMSETGMPIDIKIPIARTDYEQLVSHLIDKTLDTCAQVLDDADCQPEDIDDVLFVGGQTRMPLLEKRLSQFFGKQPSKQVHPDEAVAVGAAIYAHSLSDDTSSKLQLLDVIPMAIGVADSNGNMHTLFERNSPVPNQKAVQFTNSRDNQQHLVMRIYQGDDEQAANNTLLGEFVISGLRPGAKGTVRVEAILDLTMEGILEIHAKDIDTGVTLEQKVHLSVGGGAA